MAKKNNKLSIPPMSFRACQNVVGVATTSSSVDPKYTYTPPCSPKSFLRIVVVSGDILMSVE
jgi:hypothetical protein